MSEQEIVAAVQRVFISLNELPDSSGMDLIIILARALATALVVAERMTGDGEDQLLHDTVAALVAFRNELDPYTDEMLHS